MPLATWVENPPQNSYKNKRKPPGVCMYNASSVELLVKEVQETTPNQYRS